MSPFFKTPVSLDILFNLLNEICLFKEDTYVIDPTSFNKMIYMNLYEPFIKKLTEYYLPQKQDILLKPPTYYNFITIVKQICKYHGLIIKSKIIYANSTKHNIYFLNVDNLHTNTVSVKT